MQVKAGEPVEYEEVDVSKPLTRLQYEILVQEALQTYEQDAEVYLKKVQARLERWAFHFNAIWLCYHAKHEMYTSAKCCSPTLTRVWSSYS